VLGESDEAGSSVGIEVFEAAVLGSGVDEAVQQGGVGEGLRRSA
jgi:hypothetical protein